MNLYTENPKESIKESLELIKELNMVVLIQDQYTKNDCISTQLNEQSKNEIKKTT